MSNAASSYDQFTDRLLQTRQRTRMKTMLPLKSKCFDLFFAIGFHSSCLLSLIICISVPVPHQFLTPSTAITILPHYSNLSAVGLSLISEFFFP